ncbi:stress-induced protein 1-like [Saccoglossus kowalevskii]|uniref:Stress-induced protein 1-like n=1 Tax=Saccoglossus kowalevskii TaxID=10224 RepID=A0ABM0MS23_SACKO|nr:PREDICTED: stress-induced protein 1-like [Saccoglossus kowalevskii]
MLEELLKPETSCDDWHARTPRKAPVKRKLTKQEAVSGEAVTVLPKKIKQRHIEQKARNFTLAVDVGHVNPDDLKVKLSDHVLTVTGESTETDTDGNVYSMYTFTREFTIPEDVDVTSLTSKFTGEGVLIFEAPRLALKEPTERHLSIAVDKTDEPKEPTVNELTEET